jgi:integration host factor subunit beta
MFEVFLSQIGDQLAAGGRVELRGFGVFSARKRVARIARNPRTGTTVQVGSKYVFHFRAGKEMRLRLNR